MSLTTHAKRELELAGLFDKDSDYNGFIGESVMGVVNTISKQGQSGYSMFLMIDILNKILKYEPLTPLTGDDSEWEDRSELSGYPLWQNNRCSSVFKDDYKAFHIDGNQTKIISFPYDMN